MSKFLVALSAAVLFLGLSAAGPATADVPDPDPGPWRGYEWCVTYGDPDDYPQPPDSPIQMCCSDTGEGDKCILCDADWSDCETVDERPGGSDAQIFAPRPGTGTTTTPPTGPSRPTAPQEQINP